MKHEARFKRALMLRIQAMLGPTYFAVSHTEQFKSGIPDISLHGHKRTTWWELKHATPNFSTKEVQERTCVRLDKASYACRYVVYQEVVGIRSTIILLPAHVLGKHGRMVGMPYDFTMDGFDHAAVVRIMRDLHEG